MMIRGRYIYSIVLTVLLSMACVVSCSKVNIVEDTGEKSSIVSFKINWKNFKSAENSVPQSVTVLMNRVQNITVHYACELDSDGNIISTQLQESEIPSEPQQETTPSEPDPEQQPEQFIIQNGYYQIAAIAAVDASDYTIPDIGHFEDSLELRMKEMYAKIPEISSEEKLAMEFMDLNSSYPLVRSIKPFYCVKSSASGVLVSSRDTDHLIELVPEQLTRSISFTVRLNVEEGVVIEKIYGVISGVPQQVRISSGLVSNLGTGKMYFPMTRTNPGVGTDHRYKGNVNVFGLFPSTDEKLITGPGILNVVVYAGAEENGVEYNRVFHASLNMKKAIEKAKIMVQMENKSGYVLSGIEDVKIEVERFLQLTRTQVISGTGNGFEIWQENNTDGEEGMNPEV